MFSDCYLLRNMFAGFVYGIDTLKSIILTLACADRFLTPEKAVLLSRLEEEFQVRFIYKGCSIFHGTLRETIRNIQFINLKFGTNTD